MRLYVTKTSTVTTANSIQTRTISTGSPPACGVAVCKIGRLPGYARGRGRSTPGLVRATRTRPAVAAHARPVRDHRLGGDAAADAGRARDPALPRLAGAVADGGGAGSRIDSRRHPRVARARLQPPGPEPPSRGAEDRGRGLARRSDGPAGGRPVHGCGGRELRARP